MTVTSSPAAAGIDRSSPMPLYHQLEELLRHGIDEGRYLPGTLLPSESEICVRYGVSRSVVRQTLTNLAHAGLIRTQRGRGSFVAEPKLHERYVQRLGGLHADLHQMGYETSTTVVFQAVVELPARARETLRTERGIQVDRVRAVDGRKLAFIRSYLPQTLCPDLVDADLENRSLYAYLSDEYGLRPAGGRRTVESVMATGEIAMHLGVADADPLLLLRSLTHTEHGVPLEWNETWHRGDRTTFEIEITPGDTDNNLLVAPDGVDAGASLTIPHVARRRDGGRPHPGLAGAMRSARVVTVLRAPHYADPRAVVRCLVAHGLPVVEFPLAGAGNALEAIAAAAGVEGAVVGAGDVPDPRLAHAALTAGAAYLTSPLGGHEFADTTYRDALVLAGLTPSEIWTAWRWTGMPVKVLPASVWGPAFVRSLTALMPDVPLIAAGGVDSGDLGAFLAAGATAVNADCVLGPATADDDHLRAVMAYAAGTRGVLDALER